MQYDGIEKNAASTRPTQPGRLSAGADTSGSPHMLRELDIFDSRLGVVMQRVAEMSGRFGVYTPSTPASAGSDCVATKQAPYNEVRDRISSKLNALEFFTSELQSIV